jgi:hypothetical protein
MVVAVTPLPIGNALRINLSPPKGARLWNLLRNTTNSFAGPMDPNATIIASQSNEPTIYDAVGLTNGTLYWYQAFYWNPREQEWIPDPSPLSGTPAANYFDDSSDALTLVRERVNNGIQNEVALGNLVSGENANGVIKVLTAPPVFEESQFPLVVVHLTSESPAEHGIGELIDDDARTVNGMWNETEGWLAKTVISVVGWTQNPDVRIAMRKALRRIIVGNLQVFNAAGLREIDFSQEDTEELTGQYGAPIYWAQCTFSCLSPIIVGGQIPSITGVTTSATVVTPGGTDTFSSAGSSS